jgi:hypothetical protein
MVLEDCSTRGIRQGNITHAPKTKNDASVKVLNPPRVENQTSNRVIGTPSLPGLHKNNKNGKPILITTLPAWVVHIRESESKAWESPGRELTKISKKKTWKALILKGEMGNSSSFHHA